MKITLSDLVGLGTLDAGLQAFLAACVSARKNLLVTGGTGAGKTTMLRALCAEIPPSERLVTIEDALELGLDRDREAHPDAVAMQAREPNVEGEGEVTQADLVRWALRMSPDRVLVGEIRGAEVIPMCNAMSQGNDGSMATLHASSSKGAFSRLGHLCRPGPRATAAGGHQPHGGQRRRLRGPPRDRRPRPTSRLLGARGGRQPRTPRSAPTRSTAPGPTVGPSPGPRCGARPSTTWWPPGSTPPSSSATAGGGSDDRPGCPPRCGRRARASCSIVTGWRATEFEPRRRLLTLVAPAP